MIPCCAIESASAESEAGSKVTRGCEGFGRIADILMLSTPRREGSAVGAGSGGGSSSSMGSASTKYFLLIFGYVLSFFRAEKGARGLLRILYIADGAKTAKARWKNPSASVGAERTMRGNGGTGMTEEDDTGGTPFDKGASP